MGLKILPNSLKVRFWLLVPPILHGQHFFYRASGVITESGGPLSHGAVTARELGLPAVMGIRRVMNTLKNGQRVKVDGQKGIVELL
ncbi:PEP-utilizing enzyme [Providencia stuartii]|nr:PEP-utilizing enzyme [Providencia stuartii]